jgi:hypothetical protein
MLRKEIQRPRAEESSSMTEPMKMQVLVLRLQCHHSKINHLKSDLSEIRVEAKLQIMLVD